MYSITARKEIGARSVQDDCLRGHLRLGLPSLRRITFPACRQPA